VNSIIKQHTKDTKCIILNPGHFTLYKYLQMGWLTGGFKDDVFQ